MKEQDDTSPAASMQSDPDPSPSVALETAPRPEPPEAAPLAPGPPESAAEQSAEIPVEENVPVIDIHPPAHGGITRRDFFVHLFIVVLGILIAIGMEQGVEYIHHRQELAEARRELATEYQINLAVYRTQRAEFSRFIPILQRNIAIFTYLRAHSRSAAQQLAGRVQLVSHSAELRGCHLEVAAGHRDAGSDAAVRRTALHHAV